jgi:hypothetical protein
VQIFVNGVPRGAKGTFTAPSIPVSEANVFVGCKQTPGGVPCGDFIVDDFQMWNRALSAEQIYKEVFVDQVRNARFRSFFRMKINDLPRQARDKRTENLNEAAFHTVRAGLGRALQRSRGHLLVGFVLRKDG